MYVLLHGAIRNAGDFLIKDRAIALLRRFRPEHELVELPRWEPVDAHLDVINSADAVILCGGPAFQPNLHPGIYPLTKNLDDVRPPIIPMGLGWKHPRGEWCDTWNYLFTPSSVALLERIGTSGCAGGCRDYHTQHALMRNGVTNLMMTGCPAWYDLETLDRQATTSLAGPLDHVAFSLGVGMYRSRTFLDGTLKLLNRLKIRYGSRLQCVFHHPPELHNNREVLAFLDAEGIGHIDVSGSVERMVDYYSGVDLHVGFRVHAHILMMSHNGRSVLIAEDGRGMGVQGAMGGAVVVPYAPGKWLHRLLGRDAFQPDMALQSVDDVVEVVAQEEAEGFPRSITSHLAIRSHFPVMQHMLRGLP